jgi:hypothetical protein
MPMFESLDESTLIRMTHWATIGFESELPIELEERELPKLFQKRSEQVISLGEAFRQERRLVLGRSRKWENYTAEMVSRTAGRIRFRTSRRTGTSARLSDRSGGGRGCSSIYRFGTKTNSNFCTSRSICGTKTTARERDSALGRLYW